MITNKELMKQINNVGRLCADIQYEQVKINNKLDNIIKEMKQWIRKNMKKINNNG